MSQEPILIVLCARITLDDIATTITHALSQYGMSIEQHNIPQCSNPDEPKHPNYYDSLVFRIIEHNLFSTGHKVGSRIVSPAINDCLGYRDIDIHVIGSDAVSRQAIVQRLNREFKAMHDKTSITIVPFETNHQALAFMPYMQECTALADLKDTTVNIAYKAVRENALLDEIMRATGVPPVFMRKERV